MTLNISKWFGLPSAPYCVSFKEFAISGFKRLDMGQAIVWGDSVQL